MTTIILPDLAIDNNNNNLNIMNCGTQIIEKVNNKFLHSFVNPSEGERRKMGSYVHMTIVYVSTPLGWKLSKNYGSK